MRRLINSPGKRYVLVGGLVYLLELVVIVVAQKMGATAVAAVAWSFWFGLVASFILQKAVTFGDKRVHHKVLLPQLAVYAALVLFNFGFTIAVTKLFESVLPPVVTRTLAIGITTIWNYYLYKTRIFHRSDNPVY